MKKKDEIHWGMLWQDTRDIAFEDVLKDAVDYFLNKYFVLPELIRVNPDVDLKQYGAIQLRRDDQMYSKSLLTLMLPKTVEIEK